MPPLVIGPVSYIGDSPVVVLALGGVGKGFDTLAEAMEYVARVPCVHGEPQQVFGLVGKQWVEIMPRDMMRDESVTPRVAAELRRLAALMACKDRGVPGDSNGVTRSRR